MNEFADLRGEFAVEFAAAGLWVPIRVTTDGSPPQVIETHAGYRRPDNTRLNVGRLGGTISSDHELEYQADQLPSLAENDVIEFLDDAGDPIAGKTFRVRQAPYVTDNPADDQTGYFMRALLTKIADIVVTPPAEFGPSILLNDGSYLLLNDGSPILLN